MAKRKPTGKSLPEGVSPEALMQMMEQMLAGMDMPGMPPPRQKLSKQPKRKKLSKLDQLLDDAYDSRSPEVAYPLLLEAYKIDPDNLDALCMLSDTAPGLMERLRFKQLEVEAERKTIPDRIWNMLEGQLWLEHNARPYLVALWELAQLQWECNQFQEAIATAQQILTLNQNDNQGVREVLIKWFFDMRRFDEADTLLQQFPEDGLLALHFTRPLLAFHRDGDTPQVRQLLKLAKKSNKHVVPLLLSEEVVREVGARSIEFGGKDEAQLYAMAFRVHWVNMPGALDWLREQSRTSTRIAEPVWDDALIKQLMDLPQEKTGWIVEYRQLPQMMKKGKKFIMPWLFLIIHTETGMIVANELLPEEPTVAALLKMVSNAMKKPLVSRLQPHRPEGLVVIRREANMLLGQYLKQVNVEVVVHDTIEILDETFDDMIASLCQEEVSMPALVQVKDVTTEELELFYQRATDFFRQAPWLRTIHERQIRVECPHLRAAPYSSTIMGRLGVAFGFTIYFQENDLRDACAGISNHQLIDCGSMRFDSAFELSPLDLMNIEKNHFAYPARDLYPNLMLVKTGFEVVQPTREVFELASLLCAALPQLVAQRKLNDPTPFEYFDEAAPGKVIRLTWNQEVPPW